MFVSIRLNENPSNFNLADDNQYDFDFQINLKKPKQRYIYSNTKQECLYSLFYTQEQPVNIKLWTINTAD